ncbi:helix-turn-helix domain-containing protein [Paenibacillus ihumii]|uniref:helix-turn-helix domain-containing protein n=1 Tax=Paenibacillus ihumii TaxID=687436 RepID=UPI0006D77B04|nr:helix-turn-helix transcriptional regulator [Paenibacillus ihumii]
MRMEINLKNIEAYMQSKGWDESELAEKIGVSRTQVYRVLRGQRSPGNEFIAGLLNACREMGLNDLFIFEDPLPLGNEDGNGEDGSNESKCYSANT